MISSSIVTRLFRPAVAPAAPKALAAGEAGAAEVRLRPVAPRRSGVERRPAETPSEEEAVPTHETTRDPKPSPEHAAAPLLRDTIAESDSTETPRPPPPKPLALNVPPRDASREKGVREKQERPEVSSVEEQLPIEPPPRVDDAVEPEPTPVPNRLQPTRRRTPEAVIEAGKKTEEPQPDESVFPSSVMPVKLEARAPQPEKVERPERLVVRAEPQSDKSGQSAPPAPTIERPVMSEAPAVEPPRLPESSIRSESTPQAKPGDESESRGPSLPVPESELPATREPQREHETKIVLEARPPAATMATPAGPIEESRPKPDGESRRETRGVTVSIGRIEIVTRTPAAPRRRSTRARSHSINPGQPFRRKE